MYISMSNSYLIFHYYHTVFRGYSKSLSIGHVKTGCLSYSFWECKAQVGNRLRICSLKLMCTKCRDFSIQLLDNAFSARFIV